MTAATERAARLEDRYGAVAAETRHLPVPADDRVGVVAFEYRGPAARVLAGIFGAVATAHAAAVTGSVATTRTVVLAATTPAHADAVGRNGAVSVGEEIPGQTAEAAAVAQAGTITAIRNTALAGPVAIAYAIAPDGVTSAAGNTSITGVVAAATADTPAGIVDTIRHTSIEAPTAVADAAAKPGTITAVRHLTITGTVATATADAPAGVVEFVIHATILGQVATADAAADAGTVTTTSNATISGAVAEADATAVAGTVITDSNAAVSGFVANATTTAHAGIVQAARNVTVTGTVAAATTAAHTGDVTAVFSITRQRMNKNSGTTDVSNGQVLTGWTSDSTYPATIASNRYLQVQGNGTATINVMIRSFRKVGSSTADDYMSVRVNGGQVGVVALPRNFSYYNASTSISMELHHGDLIDLTYTPAVSGNVQSVDGGSNTYVEVNPT